MSPEVSSSARSQLALCFDWSHEVRVTKWYNLVLVGQKELENHMATKYHLQAKWKNTPLKEELIGCESQNVGS